MRLFDLDRWEEIFDSFSKNRTRTVLTAFGIFWGIFMLILLMGGGRGLESMLGNNLAGFASNSGFLFAENTGKPYKGFRKGRTWNIELSDVKRVKGCVEGVDVATPIIQNWGGTAMADNHSCSVTVSGERSEYAQVDDPKIKFGRPLNDVDDLQHRKVCVVGTRIVEELFPELGKEDPCGRFIQLDGVYYCIVGVSGKSANGISLGGNAQTMVHLPYGTMQQTYNCGNRVDMLALTALPGYKMSDVQARTEQLLKRVHVIHPEDTEAVVKLNTEAVFAMIDNLLRGVSILVWMIGLGTLLAGAIGVSNIMIVTVKERTTEIGIRRAIGATPLDILSMVMSESVVLTLLSGMSGITLAVLILQGLEVGLREIASDAQFQISFGVAVGAASLLAVLGLVAGLAPAVRAMKIKPIDAMREE